MAFHRVEDGPWPRGTTVTVWPEGSVVGGVATGPAVSSAVADADGVASFGNLTEGATYTAMGHGGSQTFEAINQETRLAELEGAAGQHEVNLAKAVGIFAAADPNGVVDSIAVMEANLQTLIDGGQGGIAFIPAGLYAWSRKLRNTADNITILGAGMGNPITGTGQPTVGGTVIRPTASFTDDYALDFSQGGTPDRALASCHLRDFTLDGFHAITLSGSYIASGTVGGVRWQVFNGSMENVRAVRMGGHGFQLIGNGATAYPDGCWDNHLTNVISETVGGNCFDFASYATDNILTGCIGQYGSGTFAANTGHGVNYDDTSSGNQVNGGFMANCQGHGVNGANLRNLQFGGGFRIIDCSGGIYLTGNSGGSTVIDGVTFRSCSYGGDGLYDGINIAPTVATRGAVAIDNVSFSTLQRNGPAYAMRYLINLGANVVGADIGVYTWEYLSPATRCYVNGQVNNLGTGVGLAPRVIAQSAVAASVTGTLTETTLATITIPGMLLGPNGRVRITTSWTLTNSANNKTLKVKLAGVPYLNSVLTASASARFQVAFANRNSQASQVGDGAAGGSIGGTTGAVVTSALDMTVDQALAITGTLANTGETITLEYYSVEVVAA